MHFGHFWSNISGFYPPPLDGKNLSFFKASLSLQGLTLTTIGLVIYRVFTIYLEFRPENSDFGRWEKIMMEPFIYSAPKILKCLMCFPELGEDITFTFPRLRYQILRPMTSRFLGWSLTKRTRPTARLFLTLASWPWAKTISPLTTPTWSPTCWPPSRVWRQSTTGGCSSPRRSPAPASPWGCGPSPRPACTPGM